MQIVREYILWIVGVVVIAALAGGFFFYPSWLEHTTLTKIKDFGMQEEYVRFAEVLRVAYNHEWDKKEVFLKAESDAYVKATVYFDQGNYEKALDIGTMVYTKVPEGWRFRYLRIRALEKLGRQAFDQGAFTKAEEYAQKILQMMFRFEGTNLMADIYIAKIKNALDKKDRIMARNDYLFIKDYEVSPDRKKILDELSKKLL